MEMEEKRVRRARNNVVSHTFFYRPIYYNQKNERRENFSNLKHIETRKVLFKWLLESLKFSYHVLKSLSRRTNSLKACFPRALY